METTMTRSTEKGIALVLALFMVLIMSTLATSLMFVSQTETWSSQNYKLMSQARYGAESGVHKVANYLVWTCGNPAPLPAPCYNPPSTANVADPIAAYNATLEPVTWGGNPVVLSNVAANSNYPVAAVKTAFAAVAKGAMNVDNAVVNYTVTARLLAMREITSAYTSKKATLMTWEITSSGTIGGVRRAETEVAAILERPTLPAYSYAAFATNDGCGALNFFGGATTDSYDSKYYAPGPGNPPPSTDQWGGNVGTNGNLDENGNPTQVYGSLSTPRSGVGVCSVGNVTALSGNEHVAEGLVPLAQEIEMPTPDDPNPWPPLVPMDFSKTTGCPPGTVAPACVPSTDGATLDPSLSATPGTMVLGDVSVGSHALLHLKPGNYIINSFQMQANSQIIIDPQTPGPPPVYAPVIIQVAGKDATGMDMAVPITITGQGISNQSYTPENLQIVYAGTGEVKLAGGAETSALLYAPNASASFTGGSDWYGSVVVNKLKEGGGASIHYDRRLSKWAVVAGPQMMNAFTWKKF
jgi:PilX N-terminal